MRKRTIKRLGKTGRLNRQAVRAAAKSVRKELQSEGKLKDTGARITKGRTATGQGMITFRFEHTS